MGRSLPAWFKYVLGGGVVVGAFLYLILVGLGQNLVYFVTPTEYAEAPARYARKTVRLGGLVKPGSVTYEPATTELRFVLTDQVVEVPVEHRGTPPALFKEGQGVVVEGRFDGQLFRSHTLLVKHSETYQPPADGQPPEEVRALIREAR